MITYIFIRFATFTFLTSKKDPTLNLLPPGDCDNVLLIIIIILIYITNYRFRITIPIITRIDHKYVAYFVHNLKQNKKNEENNKEQKKQEKKQM